MRTKEDIEFHQLGYGYKRVPAVNVKVHQTWNQGYKEFIKDNEFDPDFTEEWIEEHISEDSMQNYWQFAIEGGWESLQMYAEEIYGRGTKVYSEGRQGGWAYIDGINTDTESWDAIEFGKWRRFAKWARQEADGIMYSMIDMIYINAFEAWKDERSELRAPDLELAIKGR